MSFQTALSGLTAASRDLTVTGHNIANANTAGFKGGRTQFAEVYAASSLGLAATQTGSGVRVSGIQQQFGQGSIDFTNNALDLSISGEGFFTFNANGATVYSRAGSLSPDRNGMVVNTQGHKLQVYPPQANGTFDAGRLTDLQLPVGDAPPQATTNVTLGLNLPAASGTAPVNAFDPADASSYSHTTSLTVYDSLGAAHTASFYFVPTDTAGQWDVHSAVDGTSTGAPTTMTFDANGALSAPVGGTVTLPALAQNNGASDLEITLDLSDATQFGDNFNVTALTQDGFATGRLTGIEVTSGGVVQARYTNGQARALGQVALATFANPQGLQALGDTVWAETYVSGPALRGAGESGSFGSVQSGSLELSNVDLTAELVHMITAQRNFQANAQMISTTDQITQTVLNLR
ncbi:flagellar hook protein FlgE [Flagellatimonas centrodinii]|uniref:flagellar hook protein FlgE n=1 Tax=Flagellatimonas centrodinii TaxID=2806210 RepID=UPI001FFBE61E|nr:flagellar hook protein FlgE [Flagellatimonas centrodinii]ULQ45694.1 flagellar hook protein FlgE [Flagellatimonas centrodinii]